MKKECATNDIFGHKKTELNSLIQNSIILLDIKRVNDLLFIDYISKSESQNVSVHLLLKLRHKITDVLYDTIEDFIVNIPSLMELRIHNLVLEREVFLIDIQIKELE